jgi:hypothetical protein
MSTERTAEEAEDYIIESMRYWKSYGLEKRIISLSKWAEYWRVIGENAEMAFKIKILDSGMRNLKRIIDDYKKLNMDTHGLQEQWQQMFESLTDLQSTYNPPTKRTRKSNK